MLVISPIGHMLVASAAPVYLPGTLSMVEPPLPQISPHPYVYPDSQPLCGPVQHHKAPLAPLALAQWIRKAGESDLWQQNRNLHWLPKLLAGVDQGNHDTSDQVTI